MLLLLFQINKDRYGLETTRVREVIPLVDFQPIHHAPAYVAGFFNYHGTVVPVIDVTALLTGQPAPRRISTRLILVDYPAAGGVVRLLGLVAERVVETVTYAETDPQASGIVLEEAPYLGDVLLHREGMIQKIGLEKLLPPAVQEILFATEDRP